MVTKAELVREKSEPPARIHWGAWVFYRVSSGRV
jgi:hypothetical protein